MGGETPGQVDGTQGDTPAAAGPAGGVRCPLTIAEAKARLLEEPPAQEGVVRGWVRRNPGSAALAAVGIGLVVALSPRLRRLAVPLLSLAIRKSIF